MNREKRQAKYQVMIIAAIIAALVILLPSWSVTADTFEELAINDPNIIFTDGTDLPAWEPRIDETFTMNQVVIYRDRVENIDENSIVDDCKSCGPAYTPFYIPQTNENRSSTPSDLNSTSEILVPPINWPHATTVKIITTWPNGTTHCSGSLIQPGYVLTAGHCVYTHQEDLCEIGESSCWLEDIEIISKYYLDASSMEASSFDEILTFTPWTGNRDFNFDLAAIKLIDPLGEASKGIGWLGIGYQDSSYFENKLFSHTSFHALEPNDTDLYQWQGYLQTPLQPHQFFTLSPSFDGQGGAGLFEAGSNHIVFGVLSHQSEDLSQTGFTRISNGKFTAICDWMDIDSKDFNQQYFFPLMVR